MNLSNHIAQKIGMLLAAIMLCPAARAASSQRSLVHDGIKRTYRVHLPTEFTGNGPYPLLLVFHGGFGTAAGQERISGMDATADRHQFIAVYPDGVDRAWNDGRKIRGRDADDVGFISQLLDELSKKYKIDQRRIFACGLSNGGFFAQQLALALPGKIAAVSSVAASVPVDVSWPDAEPIPILFFLGDKDPVVPFGGGEIRRPLRPKQASKVVSAQDAVTFWVKRNHCNQEPVSTINKEVSGDTGYTCTTYSSSSIPEAVVCYTLHGGGHTWPGGKQYLPTFMVGRALQFLNANEIMWSFFSSHPQPKP